MPPLSGQSPQLARIARLIVDGTANRTYSTRPSVGAWRSLVARCNGVAEAGGSNPLAPTIFHLFSTGDFRTDPRELLASLLPDERALAR